VSRFATAVHGLFTDGMKREKSKTSEIIEHRYLCVKWLGTNRCAYAYEGETPYRFEQRFEARSSSPSLICGHVVHELVVGGGVHSGRRGPR